MKPRAITFDFWRTLFRDAHSDERQALRIRAFMAATGTTETDTREAFNVWPLEFYRVHMEEQRTLTPRDALDMVCAKLGVTLAPETADELTEVFASAILEYQPLPIDGALDAVRAAAERVPVGLVSDTSISPGRCLRRLLDWNGFTPYFQCMTFSDELGVAKPRAPMFERTATALGVPTSALLHIGDLEPTDVVGIHGVGGVAALFCGDNTRFHGNTKAEHVFASWPDFIDALPDLVEG